MRALQTLLILWLALAAGGGALGQQKSPEAVLPLDGSAPGPGRGLMLSWADAQPPRVGPVLINRRVLGAEGGETWQKLELLTTPALRYLDTTAEPGIAYEYQVMRTARDIVDVGYWIGGRDLPAIQTRGTVHLVAEETLASALAPRLERFAQDLTGAGWQVLRHSGPRGLDRDPRANLERADRLRTQLHIAARAAPKGPQAVILLGHLPLVESGRSNPDGHEPIPQPTDLFYADLDGTWVADADGILIHNRVPGDRIEMQIGRIDFAPVSGGDKDRELHLLRAYLDKNHHWRHGRLGDLRAAYGASAHLRVEQAGLRNIVGPAAVTAGGHHDAGETQPWLWGVDFGNWDGRRYAQDFRNKAVFAINFGSAKQRIGRNGNAMVALLAQPWYPLAVGWGGRPAWQLHLMALGGTIGEVHQRTVNNGQAMAPYRRSMDYYPTGDYLWRNPVWVNLLGDPTLGAFPLAPPSDLTVRAEGTGLALGWAPSPDPDVTGYRVYRAGADGVFAPLHPEPLATPGLVDPAPVAGARYMVRATGRKTVHAGSFHTLSQGIFAAPGTTPPEAPPLHLSTPAGQPLALPARFNAVEGGLIHAFIAGPETGEIAHGPQGWVYTPPDAVPAAAPDAAKTVLRYSVSDGNQTAEGRLTITLTPR